MQDDLERQILLDLDTGWDNEPKLELTAEDLDVILGYFPGDNLLADMDLASAIRRIFRSFLQRVTSERYRMASGKLRKVSKPSTIVSREMVSLREAVEAMETTLAQLDQATRSYIDNHLEDLGVVDENNQPVDLSGLEDRLHWPLEQIAYAAMLSNPKGKAGPANTSQRMMIEELANWWELSHGKAPTTDKGRGHQKDPFLTLCQCVNSLARDKLTDHFGLAGGQSAEIGSLNLSGIVADVLKSREETTP